VENQLSELRRFARSQGWHIAAEYIDHESAKTAERPQFKRLFAEASQRRYDLVLFWALDRLTREGVLATLQHLNTLSSYGVGFRSFTEPYLDSCGLFKDAVISILATIAKQERLRLSERVRAGLQTARSKGRVLGRPRKALDASRIALLRSQGASYRTIAKALCVSVSTIHAALRSENVGQSVPLSA